MTEQLERDLTELFARRAETTEVPPIPASLLAGHAGTGGRPRRRTVAIGLVAAAAVAAVAVPIGLALRDDDRPTPAPQPDAPPSLDLPYLRDGALHVDGRVLPTTGTSLVVAGDGVLVATAEAEGRGLTWERFDGDSLEAVPWLDGRYGAVVSYDGELVAAPTGSGALASLRVWDADSGEVVDSVDLEWSPSEDVWLHGFDSMGRLFWEDGGLRMRTAEGAEVDVRTGGRLLAAVLASGVVLREGDAERAFVAGVTRDGKVQESFDVPVSTTAAWSTEGPVAYVPIGEPEILVLTPEADAAPVALPLEGPAQLAGWSGSRVVVVASATDASGTNRVLLVDPATGEVEEVFTYGWDEPYPFASLAGTGAL